MVIMASGIADGHICICTSTMAAMETGSIDIF